MEDSRYRRYKDFTVMVLKLHRYIHKIKSEEISEFDLKSAHVSCLYYLHKVGTLTLTELCELCQEDKSYMARSLKTLEENGYIACDSAAKKRYNAFLYLTDKGKKLGAYVADKVDTILEPAGDGLTEKERVIFYRCLAKITGNLESICKKYN